MVAIGSTPFVYYRQMVQDNLDNERSYDQMPNFTAADVLRLTGIGRNEYIELLNQSRSKKSISMVTGLFRRTSTENKNILPKKMPRKDFSRSDGVLEVWKVIRKKHLTLKFCSWINLRKSSSETMVEC